MFPVPRLLARTGAAPPAGEPIWQDPAQTTPMPTARDARTSPDGAAAALALLDPEPATLAALSALPPARMSDAAVIDALVASEKLLAAVHGVRQRFLAEIGRRDPDGQDFLRDELACALKLAPVTGNQKIDAAVALTGRLADTGELLCGGYLSYQNAKTLAQAVEHLTDQVAAKVQERVLPRGCTQTPGEFQSAVRRAVAKFDRKDEVERHAEAYAQRNVISYPTEDSGGPPASEGVAGGGMADVVLHLAADGAEIVTTAINAWAVKTGGDDKRTADQRRADAIVEI